MRNAFGNGVRTPDRARILHEAFYCEWRKHGIFDFALRARTLRTSTALATKSREISGVGA